MQSPISEWINNTALIYWRLMKIESINLREINMRLRSPFETSFGVTQDRRILLVEVKADGLTGWGEVTTDATPSYNPETTQTAWHIISDFIAPSLIGKNLAAASDFPELTDGIRGHHMAKAGVENALWDIEAKQRGVPLWQLLGGTHKEIACGVSLGIRETPQSLRSNRARIWILSLRSANNFLI